MRPEFELYDHESDPFELNNQAENPAYAEVFERPKRELEAWMDQQGDKGAATERATETRKAEKRWYLE